MRACVNMFAGMCAIFRSEDFKCDEEMRNQTGEEACQGKDEVLIFVNPGTQCRAILCSCTYARTCGCILVLVHRLHVRNSVEKKVTGTRDAATGTRTMRAGLAGVRLARYLLYLIRVQLIR